MDRAVFSWDGDNSPEFEGYHDPAERWNGWAVPYFTLETVREIADAINALCADELGAFDVVQITDDADAPEGVSVWIRNHDGDAYKVAAITFCGQTLYSVGGWSWTWDDVLTLMPDLTDPYTDDDDQCTCEIPFTGQCDACRDDDDVPPMLPDGTCPRCRQWARDCLCQ